MRSCSIVSSSPLLASHHCCRKLVKFTPSLTWANEKLSWVAEDIITLRLWIILLRAKAKIFSRKARKAYKFSTNLHFNIQLEMIFHRSESREWLRRVKKNIFQVFHLLFFIFFCGEISKKSFLYWLNSRAKGKNQMNGKVWKFSLPYLRRSPIARVPCQV